MRVTAQQAFSFPEFCKIASRSENDFAEFGTVVTIGSRSEEGSTYTFKDNETNVLAVAHLDTVQPSGCSSILNCKGERILLCPKLDDRLGVYIITRMLPRMGITCDILLTTGEEVGMSSAENFLTDKEYNWAFSFDRAGVDVVLYQYEHKALNRVLRKAGFKIGNGSFSDLSMLDIGCSGINFGCGYYDAHGVHAYCKLSETFRMVDKFANFHEKWKDKRLPFDKCSRSYTMSGYNRNITRYSAYDHYGRDGYANYSYPHNEVIWDTQKNRYLKWYEVQDETLTQEERLETLADQAMREDNGR